MSGWVFTKPLLPFTLGFAGEWGMGHLLNHRARLTSGYAAIDQAIARSSSASTGVLDQIERA